MTTKAPAQRIVRCRYQGKYLACTGEAIDPVGEVLLCTAHVLLAIELLEAKGFIVTPPEAKP